MKWDAVYNKVSQLHLYRSDSDQIFSTLLGVSDYNKLPDKYTDFFKLRKIKNTKKCKKERMLYLLQSILYFYIMITFTIIDIYRLFNIIMLIFKRR